MPEKRRGEVYAYGIKPEAKDSHWPKSSSHRFNTFALGLLIVLYPLHRVVATPAGGLNLSLGDFVVAVVGAATLIRVLRVGKVAIPKYSIHLYIFGLAVVLSEAALLVGTFQGPAEPPDIVGWSAEIMKLLVSASWGWIIFDLVRRDVEYTFSMVRRLSIAVACIIALGAVIEMVRLGLPRAQGTFENPNIFGNYLMFNTLLAISVVQDRKTAARERWLVGILALPMLALAGVASGSRGTLLGVAFALLTLGMASRHRLRQLFVGLLAASGIWVAGSVIAVLNPFVVSRLATMFSGDGPNISIRLDLWRYAIKAFRENPVLGIGYHDFPRYVSTMVGVPTMTHNTYLSALAELGLVGLLAFAWLVGGPLVDGWRLRAEFPRNLGGAVVAFLSGTLVQGLFTNVDNFRSLWIAIGLIAAVEARSREKGSTVAGQDGARVLARSQEIRV